MRAALLAVCLAGLTLVGAAGAVKTVRNTQNLRNARSSYASLSPGDRVDYIAQANAVPGVFKRFHEVLRPGERFGIVYSGSSLLMAPICGPQPCGGGISTPESEALERASLYRIYSMYYLYPAIAATSLDRADLVLVLGQAPASIGKQFRRVASGPGGWIGRRR